MVSKAPFIEILSKVAGKQPKPTLKTLNAIWKTTIGEELGHRTRCIYVDETEIHVETDGRWLDSMAAMSYQILAKINYNTPWDFQKIIFKKGEFAPFIRPIEGAEPFSSPKNDPIEIKEQLADLDEELQLLAKRIYQHIQNGD